MYKVFIDHKPIILLKKSKKDKNLPSVSAKKVNDIIEDISPLLKKVTIDKPLQVICKDPKVEFKRLFTDFKKVTAAGGLVKGDDGYLLIFRNGLWDIPKGKMEKGEDEEETAVREIEEECGIKAVLEDLIVKTYHTYLFKKKKVLKVTYWYLLFYYGNKKLIPQTDEGITDVKWANQDELFAIRGKTYGSVNEVLDAFKETYSEELFGE